MFVTNPIGILGETEAARMLEKKGLRVVEHNWRLGHLEIDLIAENRKEIVFVEVKARTSAFGERMPEEYVDENKRRRIISAANAYIRHAHTDKQPRFDIIGLIINPVNNEVVYRNHMENAYTPHMRTISQGSHTASWLWKRSTGVNGKKK